MSIMERIPANRVIDNKCALIKNPAPPIAGTKVYSVIIPFRLTSLFNGVLESPKQLFTSSVLWRASEKDKYDKEIFPKLLEEKKIFEVGVIGKDLKPILSDSGRAFLQECEIKYDL